MVIHDADASRAGSLLELVSEFGRGRLRLGPADPTGCDVVCNATPIGMNDGDPLPVDAALLTSSMFVGDVSAGHGVTPLIDAAQAAGCKTADGGHMVEAVQALVADFMLNQTNLAGHPLVAAGSTQDLARTVDDHDHPA